MAQIVLKVEGMSCNHCRMAVENALKEVPGVTAANVDLAKKEAVVTGSADRASLVRAVEAADFSVAD